MANIRFEVTFEDIGNNELDTLQKQVETLLNASASKLPGSCDVSEIDREEDEESE